MLALDRDTDDEADGSKSSLNVNAGLTASAQTQEGQGEIAQGQSQPAGKRKYESNGADVSTNPAGSGVKRSRLEGGSRRPNADNLSVTDSECDNESDNDHASKSSSPFTLHYCLEIGDIWAEDKLMENLNRNQRSMGEGCQGAI